MDIEQLITEAYDNYQTELKAKEEERLIEEQKKIESIIEKFRQDFDAVIPLEVQDAFGIAIVGNVQGAFAKFTYRRVSFTVYACGRNWRVVTDDNGKEMGFTEDSQRLFNSLLIEMAEIRAAEISSIKPVIAESASEILKKFHFQYVEIQMLAQSEEWQKLCEANNDPEMKTHLGDVLHYLGEAMGCVEESVK